MVAARFPFSKSHWPVIAEKPRPASTNKHRAKTNALLQQNPKCILHCSVECWFLAIRHFAKGRESAGLRACLKTARGAAARDFGVGRGGGGGASPQRAVTPATTKPHFKRPAARRVFEEKAVWLRCSSVEDPQGVICFVAPCHPAFSSKTAPFAIFRQALSPSQCRRRRCDCGCSRSSPPRPCTTSHRAVH